MPNGPFSSFLPDLKAPLRDALRGVAGLAEVTEEALEPAARILPEPIQARFRSAVNALENAGRRLLDAPFDRQHLGEASAFVAGDDMGRTALESCATVICFAWEHLHDAGLTEHHLISETILARSLARTPSAGGRGPVRAASLVQAIRVSSAIGRMPGVAGVSSGEEQTAVDVALVAILVWLLAERAQSMAEEARLLDLSFALVSAIRDDALAVLDDPDGLARFMASASAHL